MLAYLQRSGFAHLFFTFSRGIMSLKERERDIIILRFYCGKTLREISSQMSISYAYVKVLQNNAFAKINNFFENQ